MRRGAGIALAAGSLKRHDGLRIATQALDFVAREG